MENKIDDIFYKQLAEQLSLAKLMRGYSFKFLSKLTGYSATQLDKYFTGKNRMTKEAYGIICKALSIDPKMRVTVDLGISKGEFYERNF